MGFIGRDCTIHDTGVIENCYIGHRVVISNALAVRNSTLLGSERDSGCVVSDGALVRNSAVQWAGLVDSGAIVENSIVGEAATVERQGLLSSSFLGPNSVLSQGEITASLAGPFTSAHHQSLLIAARWPEGKGNIGYGANVGSNHTSRLPDQEICPGEGMFFGLGCSVKFPADFSRSPFCIIATGVTTLPQRVEFPFSLICAPFRNQDGIPSAYNQIIPGWVLSENMFSIQRNEAKFAGRNRARRWEYGGSIIGDHSIPLLIDAMERLRSCKDSEIYTEESLPGLGKNFLTEEHRKRAIETYSFHIRYHALRSLGEDGNREPSPVSRDVLEEYYPGESLQDLLKLRESMEQTIAELVRKSREKDSVRGARIIEDYAEVRRLHSGS